VAQTPRFVFHRFLALQRPLGEVEKVVSVNPAAGFFNHFFASQVLSSGANRCFNRYFGWRTYPGGGKSGGVFSRGEKTDWLPANRSRQLRMFPEGSVFHAEALNIFFDASAGKSYS
jgi:hypothetical protein